MSELQLSIDPNELAWFEDSPDAGWPECICSYCGGQIKEEEIPIRLFRESDKTEARLCENCSSLLLGVTEI